MLERFLRQLRPHARAVLKLAVLPLVTACRGDACWTPNLAINTTFIASPIDNMGMEILRGGIGVDGSFARSRRANHLSLDLRGTLRFVPKLHFERGVPESLQSRIRWSRWWWAG